MNAFFQDLRFGLRTLFKNPGFVLVATLSLGLGIGAVACVFSLVYQVVWNPLPFDEPEKIVSIFKRYEARDDFGQSYSYPSFRDIESRNEVFEHIACYSASSYNFIGPDGPERVDAGVISSSFIPLVRVPPLLGRTFTPEEDVPGAPLTVILKERLWEKQFQRRNTVIGENLVLDGRSYTIIGVLPDDFLFVETGDVDLWVPAASIGQWVNSRGSSWLQLIGRLKPGISWEQADANLAVVSRALEEEFPVEEAKVTAFVQKFGVIQDSMSTAFLILFGCVGFVLLIACVNVANLLLARVTARRKEITIRIAMGASRVRLIRQLLTESLLLAILGGVTGVLFSLWGVDFIISLLPAAEADFYVQYFEFGIDRVVIAFTMAVALGSAFIFGLVPALRASRPDINENLKEGGGSGAGVRHNRLLSALVVSEVSLALVLLIAAGLMIKSFLNLQGQDPGMNPKNVLVSVIHLPRENELDDPDDVKEETGENFFRLLYARLSQLGGAEQISLTTLVPFDGSDSRTSIAIEGMPEPAPGEYNLASYRTVSPGYFKTMEIPLKKGRDFNASDHEDGTPVIIINERMAEMYWPGEDALGKRVRRGYRSTEAEWLEVVGVVGNVPHLGLENPMIPEMFSPLSQSRPQHMLVTARTPGDPLAFASTIRRVVEELDPNIPVSNTVTMEEIMNISLWERRFTTILFTVLAAVALILSSIGVYGVINYSVSQRTHEIGIRMALGARASDVRQLVVRRGLKLAALGVLIGLPLSFGLSFVLASLLYGVSPSDPLTFAGVSAMLLCVAAAASYFPARKATRVDPMIALRYE